MEEIWRPIPDYEGIYEVSNLGRIKSLERTKKSRNGTVQKVAEKIRALSYGTKGDSYAYVVLSKNGKNKTFLVHRIVAQVFLENPNDLPIINHKDENKRNDSVDNLEWCDYSYNNTYRNIHLKRDLSNVCRKIIQYDLDMNEIKRWDSVVSVEKELNLKSENILKCCKGDRIHCGGFKWRYYD